MPKLILRAWLAIISQISRQSIRLYLHRCEWNIPNHLIARCQMIRSSMAARYHSAWSDLMLKLSAQLLSPPFLLQAAMSSPYYLSFPWRLYLACASTVCTASISQVSLLRFLHPLVCDRQHSLHDDRVAMDAASTSRLDRFWKAWRHDTNGKNVVGCHGLSIDFGVSIIAFCEKCHFLAIVLIVVCHRYWIWL